MNTQLVKFVPIFWGGETASLLVELSLLSYACLCLNEYFCDSSVNIAFDPAELNQENLC